MVVSPSQVDLHTHTHTPTPISPSPFSQILANGAKVWRNLIQSDGLPTDAINYQLQGIPSIQTFKHTAA